MNGAGATAPSARNVLPRPLRKAGHDVYRTAGTVTAGFRLEPSFIMIGAQRCGTTSLFRTLRTHPQLVTSKYRKGINYFDLNYFRGERWYRGHFPVAALARRRTAGHAPPVAFEASGYYLYHPFAVQRLAHDLPGIKLVVMLRDPVERAYSAYKHEYARGYEKESFETALELEDQRLAGEIERMSSDVRYESLPHRHQSYRHRGQYAEQLERVLECLPREQLYVLGSEDYFGQPAEQFANLLAFLDLEPFQPTAFARFNARPGPPMPDRARRLLEEHYAPHDEKLVKLLGRTFQWIR